ncbi:MAG: energy transducer TonB [Bacteroidota bacterium]|nr:energy transducer TonB [Bacteroidota bacterium]
MQKSKLYGLIGSTLSSTLILLALWFVVLSVPKSTEEEGLEVGFGDSFDAGGSGYVPVASRSSSPKVSTGTPANAIITSTASASTKTSTSPAPSKQAVYTQSDNSVSLDEQKEKERVSKHQNEIIAQKAESDKRKAEQNRKEQIAINKANAVNGLFGSNGSTGGGKGSGSGTGTAKGVGSGSGNGVQGNPAGRGTSGVGTTFRLGDRSYYGNPAKPNYPKDIEGKITVNIRVDENGFVTSASIGSPTTISDLEMRKGAITAATKTRFTSGKNIETGSITYHYKLE